MPRFYCPTPIPSQSSWVLPEVVFHHAIRVLRLNEGDTLTLFDGTGGEYLARLNHVEKERAEVILLSHNGDNRDSPLTLILAQALLSHDKMDWVIQKAVELGVTHIIPIMTERSLIRLSQEKSAQRLQRWQNIVISACEQSGRNLLPQLSRVHSLSEWLNDLTLKQKLILNPQEGQSLAQLEIDSKEPIVFVIGPEGGFSSGEYQLLSDQGFLGVRLGPRVLRTETAGLAVLSIAQQLWGDF